MLQNCTHSRSFVRWRLYGRKQRFEKCSRLDRNLSHSIKIFSSLQSGMSREHVECSHILLWKHEQCCVITRQAGLFFLKYPLTGQQFLLRMKADSLSTRWHQRFYTRFLVACVTQVINLPRLLIYMTHNLLLFFTPDTNTGLLSESPVFVLSRPSFQTSMLPLALFARDYY